MKRLLLLSLLAAAATARADAGGSVVGSRHDFAPTGGGRFKSMQDASSCVFCHLQHGGGPAMSAAPETPGSASSAKALAADARQPGPGSRICLSCHDGTVAVGETRKGRITVTGGAGGRIEPGRSANLGTDLRTSHPISVRSAGASSKPPQPGDAVRLVGDTVQCSSCHDPHRDVGGKFLVRENGRSELCLACHPAQSAGATHLSAILRPGVRIGGKVPAAEQGCSVCHASHGAAPGAHLLRRAAGEDEDAACLACHSAGTSVTNIASDRAKPSGHASPTAPGVHAADEGPTSRTHRLPEGSPGTPRHVVCADCHDVHASSTRPGVPPLAAGALDGVWGIDLSGLRVAQVQFEYQVCLKCHGDSLNAGAPSPRTASTAPIRAAHDANLRRVFGPTAISSHPVGAPGRGLSVPSLRPPLTSGATVACSDCHASDSGPGAGGSGARGPHGSVYPALLERQYLTADRTGESGAAYALCYKCHDREKLLRSADGPFRARDGRPLHELHVVGQATPCAACHAAHGVSSVSGTPTGNVHLIDFDTRIVGRTSGGRRAYQALGPSHGSCALSCHGATHDPRDY